MLHHLTATEQVTWIETDTLGKCVGDVGFAKCAPLSVIEQLYGCVNTTVFLQRVLLKAVEVIQCHRATTCINLTLVQCLGYLHRYIYGYHVHVLTSHIALLVGHAHSKLSATCTVEEVGKVQLKLEVNQTAAAVLVGQVAARQHYACHGINDGDIGYLVIHNLLTLLCIGACCHPADDVTTEGCIQGIILKHNAEAGNSAAATATLVEGYLYRVADTLSVCVDGLVGLGRTILVDVLDKVGDKPTVCATSTESIRAVFFGYFDGYDVVTAASKIYPCLGICIVGCTSDKLLGFPFALGYLVGDNHTCLYIVHVLLCHKCGKGCNGFCKRIGGGNTDVLAK